MEYFLLNLCTKIKSDLARTLCRNLILKSENKNEIENWLQNHSHGNHCADFLEQHPKQGGLTFPKGPRFLIAQ